MTRRVVLGAAAPAEGEARSFDLGDRFLLVSRVEGRLYAISDWCNHAGCLLSRGQVDGRYVTCPCHGVTFDRTTGANVNAPHLCGDQDTFPVELEGDQLVVCLEE